VDRPKNLHILFRKDLEGYSFNPHRPEGLTFNAPEENLEISVRCGGKPGDFGYGHRNLYIEAKTSISVRQSHLEFIEALFDRQYLKASGRVKSLPYVSNGEVLIDETGKITEGYTPRWEMLPADLQSVGSDAYLYLTTAASRFMGLLRWQLDAPGAVSAFDEDTIHPLIYWKTTGDRYRLAPLPDQGVLTIRGSGALSWGQREENDLRAAWETDGLSEPLGHQLLREAREVSKTNDRSAMLIAYTALEVGVKQHVSKVAPAASWLAMNAPSPPLDRVIRDYLPILHSGNPKIDRWSGLKRNWSILKKFVEDRNKLAHKGEKPSCTMEVYLRLVSNMLYSLDFLEGQDWARALIGKEWQEILGWEGLSRTEMIVNLQITQGRQ
jgi:hypothetical protein